MEIGMAVPGFSLRSLLIATLAIVVIPSQALAADDMQAAMKADKTGTDRPYDGSVEVGYKMIW